MWVECSFLLVQRWKLMAIKQQLQITNLYASLGRSQAGYLAITNIECINWQDQTEAS